MKTSCMDEETLADFLEGRLEGKELNTATGHLADCTRCTEAARIGSRLIRGDNPVRTVAVPDAVTREAAAIVDRLYRDPEVSATEKISNSIKVISSKVSRWFSQDFLGNRQLEPVRGEMKVVSDNLILVKKKFRSFQAGIEIEKIDKRATTIRVTLIAGENGAPHTRVTLKKGNREMSSELLRTKLVVFESIPFGEYSLVFSKQGETIGKYTFETKETVHES